MWGALGARDGRAVDGGGEKREGGSRTLAVVGSVMQRLL